VSSGATDVKRRAIWLVTVVGVLLAAGAVYAGWTAAFSPKAATLPGFGGPFKLTDQDGRTVTDADFRGKWLLVYFGYTHCPDACPTALNAIAEALDRLGPTRDRLQPLFITLDPERRHRYRRSPGRIGSPIGSTRSPRTTTTRSTTRRSSF
jgi:cytochrome oxidase Cu insertion factor (SCO1/SenC/PrrC family)